MANISKTGIVTSNGIVNPNLLSRYVSAGGNAPGSTGGSGRTTYYGDYGIKINAENSDTYFSLYMTEQLVQDEVYTISCIGKGLLSGTLYNFPFFSQSNSAMGYLSINNNGLCYKTFTMTYTGNIQTTTVGGLTLYRLFMDDIGRSITTGQGPFIATHFKLEKGSVPTLWIPSSSDPKYEGEASSMFEMDDICKIHKNGNIQSSEFIEI